MCARETIPVFLGAAISIACRLVRAARTQTGELGPLLGAGSTRPPSRRTLVHDLWAISSCAALASLPTKKNPRECYAGDRPRSLSACLSGLRILTAAKTRSTRRSGSISLWIFAVTASCLATVLGVLLRAGFVASMPGTPEFCPRKDTPQVAHCDDGSISTQGKSPPILCWGPS
jgi:hypothetical protein